MQSIKKIIRPIRKHYFVKQLLAGIRLKKIPINRIRCQVSPFAEQQGFSGKTIDHFPPCKYFRMHQENPEQAYQSFRDWLNYCLIELETWKIGREKGGWKDGSLIALIYDIHRENGIQLERFENARHELIHKGVEKKVDYYFNLFNAIQKNGFLKAMEPPITCYFEKNLYFLRGGHHRVSALHVLGVKMARVRVLKNVGSQ